MAAGFVQCYLVSMFYKFYCRKDILAFLTSVPVFTSIDQLSVSEIVSWNTPHRTSLFLHPKKEGMSQSWAVLEAGIAPDFAQSVKKRNLM